ncbi:phage antirepressor Ant [Actinomyces sp. 432]|uniref:phage antirepressor KilAC domain-containing protein n=1 Tax=Actinomyces sp. 432 TaxID=2057798 RepID=UPI001374332F|nr:phage antirepressor KilAC domain-containing protein [Actinomyces sp. 432]QHO91049.1 phage antirepressor Ant [Actinomyces sp. 432]
MTATAIAADGVPADVETWRFGLHEIRTLTGADSEPRFVLTDLCKALSLSTVAKVAERIDSEDKGVSLIHTPGGVQRVTTVTEAGMYTVVLRSDKPEAKRFQHWVTREVLPAIRRHGGYLTPAAAEAALTDPDFIIRLATRLKEEQAARTQLEAEHAELEARVEADRPHTTLGRAVADSEGLALVKAVADVLTQEGIACNQADLFGWLRAHGWLCKAKGDMWNRPTKWALEKGYVRAVERTVPTSHGTAQRWTSKLTGTGQEDLIEGFTTGRYHLDEKGTQS